MEEEPIVEQENDVNESHGSASAKGQNESNPEEFDADLFASLMQKELIAYNLSWDPLLKVLQALGLSMAKQQKAQKSNNNSVEEMNDQVGSLREQLNQVQSEKDEMGSALTVLKDQMGEMQAQLERLQNQQGERDNVHDSQPTDDRAASKDVANESQDPFVTTKDLVKARKELSKQLTRSLLEAFGDEIVDDEADDEKETTLDGDESAERKSFKRAGAPFASDAVVKQEIDRLQQLQDALNEKLAEHDQQLASLFEKVGDLDSKSSEVTSQLSQYGNAGNAEKLERKETPRVQKPPESSNTGPDSEKLMKELSELRAVQESHDQLLKNQNQAVGKNASDIKALMQGLDDLAVQQQTAATLFAPVSNQKGPADTGDDGQRAKRRSSETGSQAQLDLSLVFTKIADLRRSTDASLDSLQQNIKEVSNATDSQQAQLDSLRNGLAFNEHQRLHMIEARLAMQKELLNRNQTHQDRVKPQLVEWRKAIELNEEKLTQGLCDEEILQELQQLQRHYRRTYLSFTPLINSPLTIAESLQVLAEEVKQFQNGVKAGVVPLKNTADGAAIKKNERDEDFTRKLRYLGEEVDATLQVNVVTEKKNDSLIKSLDAMREKLETLFSMWHRNYTQRKHASRGVSGQGSGSSRESITDSDCTPRNASSDYDGLREVELRLMSAVRRLGMVEEDVERLNNVSALNASDIGSTMRLPANPTASTSSSSNAATDEGLAKLRREVFAEIAKMTALLANLQTSQGNDSSGTSLVPVGKQQQLPGSHSSGYVNQNDLMKELYSQMKGRELDGRFQELREDEVQKQLYDNFLREVTKKVTHAVMNADKNGSRMNANAPTAPGANVNYRLMLENFTQKVEDRLDDARELTVEELLRMKKELADQLKVKIDLAMRELRSELMLLPADTSDTTAMGTKPVMCVACSRPVPVSGLVREAGSLPPAELQAEAHSPPHNHNIQPDYDYERTDDEFVFRAGFRMPANDRKTMTLPFLTATMRSKMVLNKPEGRRKRPVRQSHNANRVDNVIREAMELGRSSRLRGGHEPQQ
uniref:Uncharacterized protein n=1 Tax=Globisporangium ultimum (strain ATCC 200006 / CBS 805.95 / DAOM BR144) TaxID=431595 RepID=K3WG81_GLOUD